MAEIEIRTKIGGKDFSGQELRQALLTEGKRLLFKRVTLKVKPSHYNGPMLKADIVGLKDLLFPIHVTY